MRDVFKVHRQFKDQMHLLSEFNFLGYNWWIFIRFVDVNFRALFVKASDMFTNYLSG
jgi:hypothetical protein